MLALVDLDAERWGEVGWEEGVEVEGRTQRKSFFLDFLRRRLGFEGKT